MRFIQEEAAAGLLDEMWWSGITRVIPSQSETERLCWFTDTALIEALGDGGSMNFREMAMQQHSATNEYAGAGLRVKKDQFEDLDGKGIQMAAHWSAEIGKESQYWPQASVSALILAGETNLAYDGLAFFARGHYVNGRDDSDGTFSNLLAGSAATENGVSNLYPGALPIDDSVTTEVALVNLAKAYAYLASIKSPNGVRMRNLRPGKLIVPPRLFPRAVKLTSAKFLAEAASSGGGTADVAAYIASLGMGMPIQTPELGAAAGSSGSDTSYYIQPKQAATSQLGSLVYVERQPFAVRYYTGMGGANADLDRADVLEWHCKGRNVSTYGHPFLLFKVKAS